MQSENLLIINLPQVAEATKGIDIELTDRFFADLEQEEISGGDVHTHITVRASAGNIYKVEIELEGEVTIPCDRCLDPLTLSVEASETLKVKDADPEECDDIEILYLNAGQPTINLSWQVYEIIVTALPMQRTHPEGECNSEMIGYIVGTADEAEDEQDVE